MAIRFDDDARTLEIGVLDLVALGARGAHLAPVGPRLGAARLRLGQIVHTDHRDERSAEDEGFRAEVRVRRQIVVGSWTVVVQGRVDGLSDEGGTPVVEEVKSCAVGADALLGTTLSEWPDHARQLDVYLWILATPGQPPPMGRLVLVSVVDGARHVLGATFDADRVDVDVRSALQRLVDDRERRLAWLSQRRSAPVADPFPDWRPGQLDIAEAVTRALELGRPLLVEAPTGLGKTAPILASALRFARAHDRQVFWATHRTTQQRAPMDVVRRMRLRSGPIRAVVVGARERTCLNDIVSCRPEMCRHADRYHDRARTVLDAVRDAPDSASVTEIARTSILCPHELMLDASEEVDLIVADVNFALEPGVRLARHFADDPKRIVLVVDEAHQLADRARGWGSPRVTRSMVQAADRHLRAVFGADAAPWRQLLADVDDAISDGAHQLEGPVRDDVGVADLSRRVWRDLSDRVVAQAIDHARLELSRPVDEDGRPTVDPWLDVARAVVRVADGLDDTGDAVVSLVGFGDDPFVGLHCIDPGPALAPRLAALGGVILSSATLTPHNHHARAVGLDEDTDAVRVPSPFPPENRRVLVAPRVSTAYKDRAAHAAPIARLIAECLDAAPGNVAVFLSSFAVLQDLAGRIEDPPERDRLVQTPSMDEASRDGFLTRLAEPGRRVVLFAVLGGIFAEGVDLPAGALCAVIVVGPGLPPVGLEQDLLRAYLERHHDDGFTLASLVPGLTRVVQAAGRLHRRPEDRGVIVLVDRRFRWRDTLALLPDDWEPEIVTHPGPAIQAFFQAAAVPT